jgi:hypothetical protein
MEDKMEETIKCGRCHNTTTYKKENDGHWYPIDGHHGDSIVNASAHMVGALGLFAIPLAIIEDVWKKASRVGKGKCPICHEEFAVE